MGPRNKPVESEKISRERVWRARNQARAPRALGGVLRTKSVVHTAKQGQGSRGLALVERKSTIQCGGVAFCAGGQSASRASFSASVAAWSCRTPPREAEAFASDKCQWISQEGGLRTGGRACRGGRQRQRGKRPPSELHPRSETARMPQTLPTRPGPLMRGHRTWSESVGCCTGWRAGGKVHRMFGREEKKGERECGEGTGRSGGGAWRKLESGEPQVQQPRMRRRRRGRGGMGCMRAEWSCDERPRSLAGGGLGAYGCEIHFRSRSVGFLCAPRSENGSVSGSQGGRGGASLASDQPKQTGAQSCII